MRKPKTIAQKACELVRKGKKFEGELFKVTTDKKVGNDLYTIFSDNSAMISRNFYGKGEKWVNFSTHFWIFNDLSINQGFPVDSNKKDFVDGAVITVMWEDDSELDLCLIIDMEKRQHNFKGDLDIRVFSLKTKILQGISQTQIKKLVAKDISSYLPEELYQIAYNNYSHNSF